MATENTNDGRVFDEQMKAKNAQAVREAADREARDLEDKRLREQERASTELNSVSSQKKTGSEIEDFIMPRRLANNYTELKGKFYDKASNKVVFEDKGNALATAAMDKKTVEDMVSLARAKQWDSLKLSGSRDFRQRAWLEAESQGIKTQGYTPKESDFAALETLRQTRSKNTIQPIQEQAKNTIEKTVAPRHDLNKSQAHLSKAVETNVTNHLEAVKKIPGLESKSFEHLNEIAKLRALMSERDKLRPPAEQAAALARFDSMANNPQFQQRIKSETLAKVEDKTIERVTSREHSKDTREQTL